MLRRSLSTFMNAFTTSDYTAYPFASTNEKDFANLLSVYLDAVFFPTLDPLDFAQEGHRLEFETPDDSSSPLVYRGVVFNEMKGDMSSSRSQAWERIQHHLFSESTYHFNSGGDPAEIPKLKHSDLLEFYRHHYHPSNAMFMTWGRMDPSHMMKQFESLALGRFEASGRVIEGANEPRWLTPKSLNDVISG
jgi:Zn-dependent M16 (insulinase) family peptidase